MVRDEIGGRFPVAKSKLHVIYDSVDTEVFHPGLRDERARIVEWHGIDAAATVYLTVAGDFARAGLDTTIDALAQLAPPVHLVAIGADPQVARYRRRAQARGVGDRVTLVGNAGDARPYYGAADAFVLPSLYDPSPGAALEALACAVPVIAGTKTGVAELLREHDCGLVCPSGDVAALAGHMRALQDAPTRAGFAANARAAALPLSPAAMTLQQVLLYRDLLASAARDGTGDATPAPPGRGQ
jgi:UDP-glucose:(heptosyl)LPS alpha-1,3-glucosyltransferase